MILVILVTGIVQATFCVWLVKSALGIGSNNPLDAPSGISPFRLLASFILPSLIVIRAYKRKKNLSFSGALAALLVGFVFTISNYCFLSALLTFFFVGSKATELKAEKKRKIESDYKEGGQRNWVQIVCNGGVATEVALVYLMEIGSTEAIVNFSEMYTRSWYCMSVLGAVACCCGDTLSSEIGSVYSRSEPLLVTNFRKVPVGTNGGVSALGLICGFFGGLLVGLAYYLMSLLCNSQIQLSSNPDQWPIILVGGLAGFVGSVVDSILGATVQYSGWDEEKSCVVEKPGKNVKHISGLPLLDNHSVNLVTSLMMAFLTPMIAIRTWAMV